MLSNFRVICDFFPHPARCPDLTSLDGEFELGGGVVGNFSVLNVFCGYRSSCCTYNYVIQPFQKRLS